jgi:O-antigen ligase
VDGGGAVEKRTDIARGWQLIVPGLCLLTFGAPLTVNAFGAPFHAGMRAIALGLGIVWLASGARVSLGRALWPWIALWGLGVFGSLWSLDPPAALAQALDRTAIGAVLLILASAPSRARRPIVLAGVAGLLLVAAWGLLQRFGIHPFMDRSVWEPSRPTRPLGTHNLMGGYLAAWLPAAAALALGATGAGRLLGATAALVGFACFLETESRGAWLALLITGLVVPVTWFARGGRQLLARAPVAERRAIGRIGIGLAIGGLILGGISAGTLKARLATEERSRALEPALAPADSAPAGGRMAPASALTSFERRSQVVQSALALVREKPFLGWGPGSFRLAFYLVRPPAMQRLEAETGETAVHAHSDPLELAAELGLAGLLAAGLGLALAYPRIAARIDPRLPALRVAPALLDLGLAIGAAAILLHSVVDFDLHEAPTLLTAAILLGLLIGTAGSGSPVQETPGARDRGRLNRAVRFGAALVLGLAIGLSLVVARSDRAYRRAYQVLARGDLAASERWLRAALQYVPDEARVWVARGEVARHRARLARDASARTVATTEAIAAFRRAAEIEPEIAARWQRLALVMEEGMAEVPISAGDLGVAVDRAQRANPLDPINRELLAPLARLAAPAGGGNGASGPEAEQLLGLLAAGKGWAAGLAARHLGDLAFARGRADEANSWYDRASSVGDSVEARAGTEGK